MTTLRYQALQRLIARILIAAMVLVQVPQAVAFTPAVAPLAATTTSVVRPNLMYVLDDSGSMAWDYTPDYINDATTAADPGSTGGSAGDGAIATVSGGVVTAIGPDGSPPSFSHKYKSAPSVVIEGTVGTGASATASWNSSTQLVTGITVNSGGSGYTSAPHVSLVGPVANATWGMCWGTTGASNQGGTPKDTNASPTCTTVTQVPYSTSEINYQYYDPKVRYERPLKADGTRYGSTEGTTTNWTAAKTDGFSATSTTTNLTTGYQHEVWCNTSTATPSAADPTAAGKCRENASSAADPTTSGTPSLQYTTTFYPNATFTFRKTYNGPAYYYVMGPSEYCTDSTATSCVRATTPQVISGTVYNIPAYYRWCAYYNPQTHAYGACQARRDLTHYIPNYLGGWVSGGTIGAQATAQLKVGWQNGAALAPTAGQSITGLTVGGVDLVGGQTFTSAGGDQNTLASSICTAVQANTSTSGYSCSVSGNIVTLQASVAGSAPNGLPVLASGPPPTTATNSEGRITVLAGPTSGYQIDTITINRTNSTSVQLLAATVTSDGNTGNTAQAICTAINAGLATSDYEAKSGDPADENLKYPSDTTRTTPACQSNAAGYVGIRRKNTDTLDNGASIVVAGPPTGTQWSGKIVVNSTAGDTKINDITIGGTSVLTTKPLTYPNGSGISSGTDTNLIAADLASKITASGCTVTAVNNEVRFRNSALPATGLCSAANTIAVSAVATSATGSFRVASTGSTNAANLGGIQVTASTQDNTTPALMGSITVTNGTSVSANATSLKNAINAYGSGFTAGVPVLNGSDYDITVTAPAGGTHNGRTFNFLAGTAGPGSSGQPSIWSFPITGATADNAHINSITCGGTTAVPDRNTGVTSSAANYIQNLTINTGSPTYGLNGQTGAGGASGYSYTCSALAAPAYRCTVTGPAGAAACSNLTITPDASITLSTNSPAAVGGSNATGGSWTLTFTDAQTDNKNLSRIRCGNSDPPVAGTVSNSSGTRTNNSSLNTGTTSTNPYPTVLATALGNVSSDGSPVGSSFRGSINQFTVSGTSINATVARWATSFGGTRCPGNSVTVTKSGGATMTVGAVTEHNDSSFDGTTRYYYTFTISNITNPNESITDITCSGDTAQHAITGSASTGATAATRKVQRLENLRASLNGTSRNNFTYSCPTAATDAAGFTCTITTTSACTSSNLYVTGDSSSGIYIGGTQLNSSGNFGSYTAGSAATSPTWTFDITDATAASAAINTINCGGTSIRPTNAPNTGTTPASTVYQRINNLTGAVASPATAGSIGPTNGYTLSCQPATSTSPSPTCTLTGPVSAPACGTDAAGGFVVTKDSSISIGTITRTQDGVAATGSTDNWMATAGPLTNLSAFSGGYSGQSTTVTSLSSTSTGTIVIAASSTVNTASSTTITATGTMSAGSGASANTIPTNASGDPPDVLSMGSATAGQDPSTATNHWKDVGVFTRVDIVSTNNSYSRASGRTDCAGSTCTYNEEIQNFANWYSFYRTRMNLMKSASTIAFSPLDDKYRVGFDNICQATGTTVKRGVAQFVDSGGETANQRTNWWSQLTGSTPSCATPLRAETAKIGRYYAGKLTGATDPLQYSCQQNFMILVTDGYWNENEPSGTSITGGDIGNVDNSATTAPRPYYDGQQASTTCPTVGSARNTTASSCRTMADIAWYYYSTDLRSSANEVTITTASPHGLSPGQSYTISGISPSGYNGTYVVFVTDSTHFGYSATSNPGAYVSGGTVNNGSADITISAASYGSGRYSNATNASGVDVSTNNVFVSADDPNQAQHMNFYAMGLGIDGQLEYRDDYQTAGTGDFYNISRGTANWPAVANLDPTGVDDLWHATVNGHGKYFSARNVPAVIAGLREALNKIGARVGSAAAAATSNLEPVAGDNFAYVASYATQDWVGDVQSRSIDVLTGDVSSDTGSKCGQSGTGCQWSAQAKLDAVTYSTRRIYVKPSSGASGDPLRAFTWANLSGSEQLYFNPSSLSQYAALSVSNASDITAENLTKYLRGDRSLEMDGNISHAQIWRRRAHVMGDIVNTQPIFMKAPTGIYSDAGYANFKSTGTAATRRPVVFVSGQDGMLHVLNADTAAVTVSAVTVQPGEEMWSFIPTQAMSLLKVLADQNYGSTDPLNANHHRYFVDGQITVADVNFGASDSDWHTILIGGQGAGGTSYFALDVTDPLNPTYLWEFTDARLGYTYANPIVAKLPNGEWAVFFSSGYNNSDGLGYLFAVNPKTGVVKTGFPMSTSSGAAGTPSNLGKIAVWATDPAINNTAEYVYAGDMNGDLWRFDLEPTATAHSGTAVFKLAHLAVGGVAQPITTKPEITQISSGTHIVYVGTGKYLESTDLTNTDVQSLYAIKDTLGADNLGTGSQTTWNPQTDTLPSSTNPAFIQRKLITTKSDGSAITQTINGATRAGRMICTGASATVNATTNTCANESSPTTMDWVTYGGWFVNFPDSGERMNVDTKLVRGTLVFAGNVPMASSCTVGGTSWVTAVDYSSGLAVAGAGNIVSTKIADSLVVGLTVVKLSSGEYKAIATKSNYQQETLAVPVASTTTTTTGSGTSNFGGKRGFWREFEAY